MKTTAITVEYPGHMIHIMWEWSNAADELNMWTRKQISLNSREQTYWMQLVEAYWNSSQLKCPIDSFLAGLGKLSQLNKECCPKFCCCSLRLLARGETWEGGVEQSLRIGVEQSRIARKKAAATNKGTFCYEMATIFAANIFLRFVGVFKWKKVGEFPIFSNWQTTLVLLWMNKNSLGSTW